MMCLLREVTIVSPSGGQKYLWKICRISQKNGPFLQVGAGETVAILGESEGFGTK